MLRPLIAVAIALSLPSLTTACEETEGGGGTGGECTPTATCEDDEVVVAEDCDDCRSVDDGCGGQLFCQPDPTCVTPCPEGQYQDFGADPCEAPECSQRLACGELVSCRSSDACLETAECPGGALPLDDCEGVEGTCLPQIMCGVTKYCPALSDCQENACDAGENPSTLGCDAFTLDCREVDACGGTISCVCRAEALECKDEDAVRNNTPCASGEICVEVRACDQVFYCHGEGI